jgi:hypothetical protein
MRRFLALPVTALVLVGGCRDLPTESARAAPHAVPILALSAQAIGCNANALIDALDAANAAGSGTVDLSAGCTYTLTGVNNISAEFDINGLPIVTGDVTINGNGATIKRDSVAPDFRIFYVLNAGDPEQGPGRLTLNEVTISGGSLANSGGGLVNNGGTLTINHGTISGHNSGDAGGALSNEAGTLTLNHTVISGNRATDAGGGVSNLGGTLHLNHTVISGNRASDGGGGVFNVGGTVTVNHTTISGNQSDDNGGGLSNDEGTVLIINGTTISQNTAGGEGGGLSNFGTGTGTVTIDNSTISGNQAGDGGGLSNLGGTLTVNHTVISGNGAVVDGGGVANIEQGVLTIRSSTLADNEAGGTGGALHNFDATATVMGSTASANRAKWGGALLNEAGPTGGTLTVRNSTISGNHAAEGGGGLFNDKGGRLTVTSSTISGNEAVLKSGGGVLSYNDINGSAEVKGSIIAGNSPDDVAAVEDKTRFNSLGYNLIGGAGPFVNLAADFNAPGDQRNVTNPGLGHLQANGGPTFTRALLSASPAVNAIPTAACTDETGSAVSLDQRGVGRLAGSACDIGAFELASALVPQTITFNQPASPQSYGAAFTVNLTASSGLTVSLSASGGCTASGYDVTVTSGTDGCVLTASQGGDAGHDPAADVVRTVDAQKVDLAVMAEDETIAFGGSPSFDVSYSGFIGTDDASSLGGTLVLTFQGTGSTVYSPSTTVPEAAGTYSVTPGGLSSDNYGFDYVAGAFSIAGGIRFESRSAAQNGGATSLSIGRPAGVKAGDFLLAQITFEKGSAAGSNSQITPSGWALVRRTNRGSDLGQAILYRVAGATEPASYTWTYPQALKAAGGILRYTGVSTIGPIVASSGNTGDSGTLTAPGVGAIERSALVAFFGLKKQGTSLSTPPGMTGRYYFESPQDVAILGADEPRASGGATGNRTSIAGHADKWVAQHVVLRAN